MLSIGYSPGEIKTSMVVEVNQAELLYLGGRPANTTKKGEFFSRYLKFYHIIRDWCECEAIRQTLFSFYGILNHFNYGNFILLTFI